MKKIILSLILLMTVTAGMAVQNDSVGAHTVQPQVEQAVQAGDLNVAALLGITENKVSDELIHQIAWSGIPNRPHFIFHTLQQCQSVPECVCEPYNGQWGCFIR